MLNYHSGSVKIFLQDSLCSLHSYVPNMSPYTLFYNLKKSVSAQIISWKLKITTALLNEAFHDTGMY